MSTNQASNPLSIWSTVEMSAASKGFDYDNYLSLHKFSGCRSAVLSQTGYALVVQILDNSIEEFAEGQR